MSKKLLEVEIISRYNNCSKEELLNLFNDKILYLEIFENYKKLKEYLNLKNWIWKQKI